jgi:hypothetical protein
MPDYIALQSIQLHGVYAHHAGDVVPEDNVRRLGYDVGTQVAEVGSEQARALLADLGGGAVEYDPTRYSVDEVNDYLDGVDDVEKARVLVAERATQHRRAVLEGRHAQAAPAEDEWSRSTPTWIRRTPQSGRGCWPRNAGTGTARGSSKARTPSRCRRRTWLRSDGHLPAGRTHSDGGRPYL